MAEVNSWLVSVQAGGYVDLKALPCIDVRKILVN